jgi:hypothetical protein
MASKYTYFKPQKIPYYIALAFLTFGASLILGFLSFSGMYALFPILGLAFAAFVLSVLYESEIYLQNIKGAFNKLSKRNYLKNYLAREYLLEHLLEIPSDEFDSTRCPQFFKDYLTQLKLLHAFGHEELNTASKARKQKVERTLIDMEHWFALELFPQSRASFRKKSEYAEQLRIWLAQHQQEAWQKRLKKRRITLHVMKALCVISALFMSVGTTYLMVEAFSVIPALAAVPFAIWPAFIAPMALIAGVAYGMLSYNAIADLINNNTLVKWYRKLRDDWKQGFTFRNLLMTSAAVLLAVLALALTICTAGTWWTIAKKARPLFAWMKRMPSFVMGIINPIITGISAVFFNLQNTSETLDLLDQATKSKKNVFAKISDHFVKGYQHIRRTENWLQMLNPFRLILKLFITPIRLVLFLGHLVSIGVTTDRMPGIPQIASAIFSIICEGFEDAHYFMGHSHHGHGGCGAHAGCAATNQEVLNKDVGACTHQHESKNQHADHHHCDGHHQHEHDHKHDHEHDHEHDHKHDHKHGHKHDHKHGHKHDHKHGHKHDHEHAHKHDCSKKHKVQPKKLDKNQALFKERLTPGHSHNHNMDIPSMMLKALAAPLYFLAAFWDFLSSKINSKPRKSLSFAQAWNKQWGKQEKKDVVLDAKAKQPSTQWKKEHTVSLIEKHKVKHLKPAKVNREIAKQKIAELNKIETEVLAAHDEIDLKNTLRKAQDKAVFNVHRLFKKNDESRETKTRCFINDLPARVGC